MSGFENVIYILDWVFLKVILLPYALLAWATRSPYSERHARSNFTLCLEIDINLILEDGIVFTSKLKP